MTDGLVLPELDAGPFLLRAFRPGDLPLLEEAAADPYIPVISSVPVPYTEAEGLAFVRRQHDRARECVGYSLAIADRAEGRAVGQIGLWLTEIGEGRAATGYWIAPSARGRGAAGHALAAVAHWALADLAIPRVHLHVEPWNTASIRTAERAGFRREGLLRSWMELGGERRDMLLYARLAADGQAASTP
ncbi:GNAT family protein [Catellatospora sp. NPDC049133]|jgi:RimJ/RimL family protein N-acetyltransferase|uniref:GNAT family N-acetyltransferase n=1 Tax=Catellatospora sp. NPDC049133 TaxID=3155499 RepID=UPI0033FCC646